MNKNKKRSLKKFRDNLPGFRDRNLIISDKTAFSIKEEYKTLRTNILFSIPSELCKIIGISSPQPLEGKSINSLNLAITFAQTDARVLLIDCDLRLPSQARLLDMDAIPGISNVLIGMNTIDEAIQKTKYFDLDVILSGDIPPNPSELLGSEKMGKILDELSTMYDYIFIDLPPINIVADTLIMSKFLSGLLLVVRASVSKKDRVIKAITKLELAEANIIGIVLTDVKSKTRIDSLDYSKYGRSESSNE